MKEREAGSVSRFQLVNRDGDFFGWAGYYERVLATRAKSNVYINQKKCI